jgi:Zn-dependent metalloprotease
MGIFLILAIFLIFMCNCLNSQQHIGGIQCILPPHMLDEINTNGGSDELKIVKNMQIMANKLRAHREHFALVAQLNPQPTITTATKALKPKLQRRIYTAQNTEKLPGKLLRAEGKPATGDLDADNVYDAAGKVWDFYFSLFGRNSIDNMGMAIKQTVHYSKKFANAFWDGTQMVYGDGDGDIFASFTKDIDVIGHELTHGIMQFEANLAYAFQSGALNESYSDVFGMLIKQKALNQTALEADWLIGRNVLKGNYALRSMKEPGTAYVKHPMLGTDPQPGNMANYKNLSITQDKGGVHINSGIPNKAFYVAARNIGGFAWEKAGRIWYEALVNPSLLKSKPDATFAEAKQFILRAAMNLYGTGSLEHKAVMSAWREVGL